MKIQNFEVKIDGKEIGAWRVPAGQDIEIERPAGTEMIVKLRSVDEKDLVAELYRRNVRVVIG